MSFPLVPLGVLGQLFLDGQWVDVTTNVLSRDPIVIRRGQADEGTQADPATCSMTFWNPTGTYSPRNPLSPYYGIIGRNTPVRIAVAEGEPYLVTEGTQFANTGASTPDAAALDITGDIDIRIDVTMANWLTMGTSSSVELAGKFRTTSNQRSWLLMMRNGRPWFEWSADGTNVLQKTATEDLTIPASGRLALRVTLDVNNGAAGNTVTFYTSDTISGTWTQLGDPVITAGTTSIFNSTAELRVGDGSTDIGFYTPDGGVHAFQLRNGIAGSVVANPDFTIQDIGDTSFADAAGRTWTVNDHTAISNRRFRFHGEVSSWPQRWDVSGNDVYSPVEAAGILRRLGQGQPELRSTLYRGLTTLTSNKPVAYWPAEDVEGATTIASAVGGPPMTITGSPQFAQYDGFASSAPIPLLNDSVWTGVVPGYPVSSQATVRFLLAVPTGGISGDEAIITVRTSGTATQWVVRYGDPGGDLKVQAYDEDGVNILDSGFIAFAVNGKKLRVALDLSQNGANIDWDLTTVEPGEAGVTTGGTLNSRTIGQVTRIWVSVGGGITDTAIGHISVQPQITSVFDLADQLDAYRGETPAGRFYRLCQEEGIPFRLIGTLTDGEPMGAQARATLLELLDTCALTDGGIMFEPRDLFGLGFRTRKSMYNQAATVALDYEAEEVAPPLEPVDDDQSTRNDITVTRDGGSSARAVLETGPLSILPPPDGVGPYASSITIAAMSDQQLPDQASWRLRIGTVDEARYPQISMNLAHEALTSNAALSAAVRALEVGDRLTISNLPSWLPPEMVSQLALGFDELLDQFAHDIAVNCVPASPYQVAVYGTARYGPYASTLAEDLTTTETGVDVATTLGPLWTTAAGNFPLDIMIGGERMTVTAISGASSPQTFTVTRSVNGIVKTHLTGAAVELFEPSYRAL